MTSTRALITTIQPIDGGVPTMTRWVCKILMDLNITPVLAWYAPWRNQPELSVPFYKVLNHRPRSVQQSALEHYEGIGIGSWLPELEFTHYLPTKKWKDLVGGCQLHLSVSGNPLCATPYVYMNIPFLAWVATPWEADRRNRVRSFKLPRRVLDSVLNKPILALLERKILRSKYGNLISLSHYTAREFTRISGRQLNHVMLMPVNSNIFYPDDSKTIRWRIGFTGRFCDPRKNISLLLNATRIIKSMGHDIELFLVGDKDFLDLIPMIQSFGLEKHVKCFPHMEPMDLAGLLRTLDIFVIPSFQEGLCISALEAMACGVPIISTRCGGPEDYVIPNQTGLIVDSNADSLSTAIRDLCQKRNKRNILALNSCKWIQDHASEDKSQSVFKSELFQLMQRTKHQSIPREVYY
jgi:glycosyltransferase involved in cell wall biosynthesis